MHAFLNNQEFRFVYYLDMNSVYNVLEQTLSLYSKLYPLYSKTYHLNAAYDLKEKLEC